MRSFTKLLCLSWCPGLVLGASYSILVQTGSSSTLAPGGIIRYAVTADPVPSTTLGIVLIPVVTDPNAGRPFIPSSITMQFSPQQATINIPSNMPQAFYTVDVHANTSVYSPLLASSNVFQIVSVAAASSPTSTQVVQQTTTQVVVQPPTTTTPAANPTTTQASPTTAAAPTTTKVNTNTAASTPVAGGSSTTQVQSSPSAGTASQSQSTNSVSSSADPAMSTGGSVVADNSTPSKKSSSAIGPAIGGAIAGIAVILILFFLWWRRRAARNRHLQFEDDVVVDGNRYRDPVDTAPTTTSPFANSFREFSPNRPMTQVSPFMVDADRSSAPTSPEPGTAAGAKYREAYGVRHAQNHSITSSGYLDSSVASSAAPEQLRNERERLLGEISALRSRGGQGSTYAPSTVGSSSTRDDDASEMRNRLDMLTQHVQRLESALEQAVNVYDAPPTYHQAPSQR